MEYTSFHKTPEGSPYPKITSRTVITKNTVTQNDPQIAYTYTEDRWELNPMDTDGAATTMAPPGALIGRIEPKTGYTYGESGAYQVRRLGSGCISPNMSRRRLRQDMHNSTSDSSMQYVHTDIMESYLSHQHDDGYPVVPNQVNAHPDQQFDEPTPRMRGSHGLRIPASATRSGRNYGGKWGLTTEESQLSRRRSRRGGRLQKDSDSVSEYSEISNSQDYVTSKMLEKHSEYSGAESVFKERELNHLLGLDSSDNEEEEPARQIHEGGVFNKFYTIITMLMTIVTAPLEPTSPVRKITSVVTYPFSLLYSLLSALLRYLREGWVSLGEAIKWLVYREERPQEEEGRSDLDQYGARSSSVGSSHLYTTTKTVTTTTVTDFISDDEETEYSYDTVDNTVGNRKVRRTKRVAREAEPGLETSESWFYTMIHSLTTTVVTATTTLLWSPVSAVKVVGRGMSRMAGWRDSGQEQNEDAGDMRSTEETTEIKLGSNVRHRRSKAWRSVDVEEKESHDLHDTWWFMRWSAYIGRSLGHGLDDLAYGVSTIVLSPAALVLGLGKTVVESVKKVSKAGGRLGHWITYSRRQRDEDADIDTTIETRRTTYMTYTRHGSSGGGSTAEVSWFRRCSRAAITALSWPLTLLLALMQWLCWALCAPLRWLRSSGLGSAVKGSLWSSGDVIHRKVANSVARDIWLLSRTSVMYRRYGCCCLIPFLILLPLLLTGAYYAYDRSLFVIPVTNVTKTQEPVVGVACSDSDLDARIRLIVLDVLRQQNASTASAVPPVAPAGVGAWSAEKMAMVIEQHRQEMMEQITNIYNGRFASLEEKIDKHGSDVAKQTMEYSKQGSDISGVQSELNALVAQINELGLAIGEARTKMNSEDEKVRQEGAMAVAALQGKLEALQLSMKDCCQTDSALALLVRKGLDDHLALIMAGGSDADSSEKPSFLAWLQNKMVNKDELDVRLAGLLARVEEEIKSSSSKATADATAAAVEAAAAAVKVAPTVTTTQKVTYTDGMDEGHVKSLIHNALLLYASDKTGKVDYALESAGGSIINTRCSETYYRRTAQLSLFGIPLWYTSNSARAVIQPDMQPGQCWAFKGQTGFLVIQLANNIYPTSFTMEHIPKSLSPSGTIDSAPKGFTVWGLDYDQDKEGILLGNFTYVDNGEPMQTFYLEKLPVQSYQILELKIYSNHGNPEYTCLYRFRVHGKPRNE